MELRKGNYSGAQKLINSLLRSDVARALAVYNVISKVGFRSRGFSEKKAKTNMDYTEMIDKLWDITKNPDSYRASPLKRTMVPKPRGGLRPISVPTYFDRAVQNLYKFVFEVWQEETADPNSFGFRPFRSPGWGAKAVTLAIWSRKGFGLPKFAIEFDIKKCFDSISHDFIKSNLSVVKCGEGSIELIPTTVLHQWCKCGYILSDDLGQNLEVTTGVPQGGPISPVISNAVFNGLERTILDAVSDFLRQAGKYLYSASRITTKQPDQRKTYLCTSRCRAILLFTLCDKHRR